MAVAKYFRIPEARGKPILTKVEGAVSAWREEGSALGMDVRELESFVEAFEHSEREAARRAING